MFNVLTTRVFNPINSLQHELKKRLEQGRSWGSGECEIDFHFADSIIKNLKADSSAVEATAEEAPLKKDQNTSEHPSIKLYSDCIQQLELFKFDMKSRFETDIASFNRLIKVL